MNRTKSIMITVGWAIGVSTIALRTIYDRFLAFLLFGRVEEYSAVLRPIDFVLIFVVSVLAGALLLDPGRIIFGYLGTLVLSALIMYTCLTLPLVVGKTGAFGRLLQESAISYTFTSILFGPLFIIIVGGLVGGFLGERFLS